MTTRINTFRASEQALKNKVKSLNQLRKASSGFFHPSKIVKEMKNNLQRMIYEKNIS